MSFLTKKGLRYFWAHIAQRLNNKVDKDGVRGLSTNDYTDEEKNKLAAIAADHLTSADKAELSGAIAEAARQAAQADWNVNDADDPAYIKNKTHYDSYQESYKLSDYSFTIPDGETYHDASSEYFILDVNNAYSLMYNEEASEPTQPQVAISMDQNHVITERYMTYKALDFELRCLDGNLLYIYAAPGTYTISVIEYSGELKQLDEKFIPSTIARVEDIPAQEQTDWAENNENNASYIKNRTHYVTTEVVEILNDVINLTADQITEVDTIPGDFVTRYDASSVSAYFDEEPCTIVNGDNRWVLTNSLGLELFTIFGSESGNSNCLLSAFAGSGQHTIRFELEQEKIVKLDDKFIPDSIPRNLDIPFLAAPDWAANENESGFIKNRTHYEKNGETYLTETIVNVEDSLFVELPSPNKNIVEGETYEVILNGEKFVCVAWKAPDQEETVFLGNGESVGYPDQGEDVSFYFDYYASDSSFYLNAAEGDYTVCINAPSTLVQLDEKYIPDTIARVEDIPEVPEQVQADWNQSDETALDFIKNKTHYELKTTEVLFDGIVNTPIGVITTIPEMPHNIVGENPDLSLISAYFDDELCTIQYVYTATGRWDFYNPSGVKVFTIWDEGQSSGVGSDCCVQQGGGAGDHSILITKTVNTVKQLDEKFIPSTIARTSSVEEIATNLETLSNSLATVATTGDYNDLINTPSDLATTSYVDTKVSELVDSSPETLNTLNELAKALGEDPNFATTVSTQIGEIRNELDAHTSDVISIDEIDAICGGAISLASEEVF